MTEDSQKGVADYELIGEARAYGVISDAILDREVTVAIGSKAEAKDGWTNRKGSVFKLIQGNFTKHAVGAKNGTCMLQGETSGGRRLANAMVALDFLFIDIDNGMSRDDICGRLMDAGLFAIIYSTYSSGASITPIKVEALLSWLKKTEPEDYTPHEPTVEEAVRYLLAVKNFEFSVLEDATVDHRGMDDGVGHSVFIKHKPIDKTRVILLLKEPYKINERHASPKEGQIEWADRYRSVCDKLGIPFDTSCRDVSRLFYLPRHKSGNTDHHIIILAGDPLNIDEYEPANGADNIFAQASASLSVAGRSSGGGGAIIKANGADEVLISHHRGLRFAELYSEYAVRHRSGEGGIISGICPFDDDHSNAGDPEDFGFYCKDGDGEKGYVAGCMHDTCKRNHANSRGECDRFKFASKFCADNGITGEDLRQWVDLEDNEVWCLEPVIIAESGDIHDDADSAEDAQEEEDDTPAIFPFATSTETAQAIAAYLAGPPGDVPGVELLLRRIARSNYPEGLVEEYKHMLTKHSGVKPKQMKGIIEREHNEQKKDSTAKWVLTGRTLRKAKEYNKAFATVEVGDKFRVLKQPKTPGTMPGFLSKNDFKDVKGNEFVTMEPTPGNYEDKLMADIWLEWDKRRQYDGIVFEPGWNKAVCEEKKVFNIWQGLPVVPGPKGRWDLLREHIRDNVCQGNDEYYNWILTWIAQIFQQPGLKMGSALAIKGERGTGKTKVFEWVRRALGVHAGVFSHKAHIIGNFNAHQAALLLMVCEEAVWAGDVQANGVLKDLITNASIMLEHKGVNAIEVSNYTRLVMLSNERWIVPATLDKERRFMVLECGTDKQQNTAFFASLDHQMATGGLKAMVGDLMTWDPNDHFSNGWEVLRNPPKTPWLAQQANEGLDVADRFFIQLVYEGQLRASQQEWDQEQIRTIKLLDNDETLISVRSLRYHFDKFIGRTYHGRNKQGNIPYRDELFRKYLMPLGEPVSVEMRDEEDDSKSSTEVCYKVPPRSQIKAHMDALHVKFDSGNANDNKEAA